MHIMSKSVYWFQFGTMLYIGILPLFPDFSLKAPISGQ
jgi:hypothetical protein